MKKEKNPFAQVEKSSTTAHKVAPTITSSKNLLEDLPSPSPVSLIGLALKNPPPQIQQLIDDVEELADQFGNK